MSESDMASVECPLCGEAFDPMAAGGWCTNSDCGEWQHETDVTPDQQETVAQQESTDETATDADDSERSEESSVLEDLESLDDSLDEGSEDNQTPVELADSAADDPDAGSDSAAEGDAAVDADATDEAATDESATDAAASTDDSVGTESATDDEQDDEESFECLGCGSLLSADTNFCPDCGQDVSTLPTDTDANEQSDACPSCGTAADPEANFCANCGQDLDSPVDEDLTTECPDCGAEVDEDDDFCATCGGDLDAQGSGGPSAAGAQSSTDGSTEPAPGALALKAHGRSVVVSNGDAVGREIRSLLIYAGRPEDEAIRVHREHVRFVRESGQFYVVALGQNPTRLNDVSLSQGDREPINPGDELELSDVVTLRVEAA